MGRNRIALLALVVGLVGPSPALSQRVPAVGDRVRVRTEYPSREAIGTVRSISTQGIEVEVADRALAFFVTERIRTLEVSQGQVIRDGNRAAAFASFIGVVGAGAAVGALVWSPCTSTGFMSCWLHPGSRGTSARTGAIIALPLGLVLANKLGRDRPADVWEPSTLPSQAPGATIRMFPGSGPGGVGLGVSLPVGGR